MLGDAARAASNGYQSYVNFYDGLDSVGFAEGPTRGRQPDRARHAAVPAEERQPDDRALSVHRGPRPGRQAGDELLLARLSRGAERRRGARRGRRVHDRGMGTVQLSSLRRTCGPGRVWCGGRVASSGTSRTPRPRSATAGCRAGPGAALGGGAGRHRPGPSAPMPGPAVVRPAGHGPGHARWVPGEDYLTVNVWTPSIAGRAPVMVFRARRGVRGPAAAPPPCTTAPRSRVTVSCWSP